MISNQTLEIRNCRSSPPLADILLLITDYLLSLLVIPGLPAIFSVVKKTV